MKSITLFFGDQKIGHCKQRIQLDRIFPDPCKLAPLMTVLDA